jgi:recombination associated protein RdgC
MWFKNLVIYRLPADWKMSTAELEEKLQRRTLVACGPYDMSTRGWVAGSPAQRLVHTIGQQQLIALGLDQKLLPGSVIRQVATERAALQEKEQGFPVGRRQMRELKERVTEELRARAFTRRSLTRAWIDSARGWFIIDTASAPRADELVATLRDTLGTFAVTLLETERSPQSAMSAWLMLGDAPLRFSIDQDLELNSIDKSKATVRYVRHPLEGREIQAHIQSGKYASRLGLTWNDRVSFVLTEKLQVKRLQFLDVESSKDEGDEIPAEEKFDADFLLMSGELSQLLGDLQEALGGDVLKQAKAA